MVIKRQTHRERMIALANNMKMVPYVRILIPRREPITRREYLTLCHFQDYGMPNSTPFTKELWEKYQHWKDTTQSIRDTAPTFAPKI